MRKDWQSDWTEVAFIPWVLGVACVVGAASWAWASGPLSKLAFVTPDWINMVLLGAALLAHGEVRGLLSALDEAILGLRAFWCNSPSTSASWAWCLARIGGLARRLVGGGDLRQLASRGAVSVSSGVLNVFVPSGGGQWAVQGPLVLEACHALGVPLERGIMAMAFGDELTNMLQPFWALPLLGITGLSARDILPYTLLVMGVAGAVMLAFLSCWA